MSSIVGSEDVVHFLVSFFVVLATGLAAASLRSMLDSQRTALRRRLRAPAAWFDDSGHQQNRIGRPDQRQHPAVEPGYTEVDHYCRIVAQEDFVAILQCASDGIFSKDSA